MFDTPLEDSPLGMPPMTLDQLDLGGELVDEEDGGVTITEYDPEPLIPLTSLPHDANLAEYLDAGELTRISMGIIDDFTDDDQSREKWRKVYTDGLDYLGTSSEEVTRPWPGAAGVYHSMLMEAVVRYQANTIMEVMPPTGPVKTQIIGKQTPEKLEASERIAAEMNDLLMNRIPGYRPEFERLLAGQATCGSAFRKVYYDPVKRRPNPVYIPAEDFIMPYGAMDLESATRYTHRMKMPMNQVRKLMAAKFYRQCDLSPDYVNLSTNLSDKKDKVNNVEPGINNDMVVLLECHCDLDISGLEHKDSDGQDTGVGLPYVVTIEQGTGMVLAVKRNWVEGDPDHKKLEWFAQYDFVPFDGAYAFGLIHLIGCAAKAATQTLRKLLDAGTLSNLPGGLKAKGLRITGNDSPIMPGEWRDVDVSGQDISRSLFPLPYKEPSAVLLQLLGIIVEDARRLASTADMNIGDVNAQAPVGTVLALMEQAKKIMSAVQARVHAGLKRELMILERVMRDHPPADYEKKYDVPPGQFLKDFSLVTIIPVSDPNASTKAQKIMQYQAMIQLSATAPQQYDLLELHRGLAKELGIDDVDKILPDKKEGPLLDPVSEFQAVLDLQPVKAHLEQDHDAHIKFLTNMMQSPDVQKQVGQNPQAGAIVAAAWALVASHLGFLLRSQIEKKLGVPLPPPGQPLPPDIETHLSVAIAEASDQLLAESQGKQAQEQAQKNAQDPVIQMQQQELQIKQGELQLKQQEMQGRMQLEQAKVQAKSQSESERVASQHQANQNATTERHSKNVIQMQSADAKRVAQEKKDSAKLLLDLKKLKQSQEKIGIEQEKVALEQKKVAIEQEKAKAEIAEAMSRIEKNERENDATRGVPKKTE